MKNNFYKWLKEQPKEFVEEFYKSELTGNGEFELDDLIELDLKFNPEGEDND